jgi:hypothetical protein
MMAPMAHSKLIIALIAGLVLALPAYSAESEKKKAGPTNILVAEFELVGDAATYSLGRRGPGADGKETPKAKNAEGQDNKSAKKEADEAAGSLDVPMMAVPVRTRGSDVTYYIVQLRLHGKSGKDIWQARGRLAVMQDALIRTLHRRSNLASEEDLNGGCEVFCELVHNAADEVMAGEFFERVEILSKAEQISR